MGVARHWRTARQAVIVIGGSLSVANINAILPVAYRLYLPEAWAIRRHPPQEGGRPDQIAFRPSRDRARSIRAACAAGFAARRRLRTPAYGNHSDLPRRPDGARAVVFAASVETPHPCGRRAPASAQALRACRGGPTNHARDAKPRPIKSKDIALSPSAKAWLLSLGARERLFFFFCPSIPLCTLRIRIALRDFNRTSWPKNAPDRMPTAEKEPTKYWLSNLPPVSALARSSISPAALAHRTRLPGA